jgi:hypothetical protein
MAEMGSVKDISFTTEEIIKFLNEGRFQQTVFEAVHFSVASNFGQTSSTAPTVIND